MKRLCWSNQRVNGAGGSRLAHELMSDAELTGGVAPSALLIGEISDTLVPAQAGNPFTVRLNAAVSSMMQAEYWATVPMHEEEEIELRQSALAPNAPSVLQLSS